MAPAARSGKRLNETSPVSAKRSMRPTGYLLAPPRRGPGRKRTPLARKPTQFTSPRRNSVRSRSCFWNTSTTGRASSRKSAAPWRIGVSDTAFRNP